MQRMRFFSAKLTATLTFLMGAGCASSRQAETARETPAAEAGSAFADGGDELEGDLEPDEVPATDAMQDAERLDDAGLAPEESLQDSGGTELDAALDAGTAADAGNTVDAPSEVDAAGGDASSEVDADAAMDAADVDADGEQAADAAIDGSLPDGGGDGQPSLQPGGIVPKPYLGESASPFEGLDFAYFYREDFEDHQLNTLGLQSVTQPGSTDAYGRLSSSFGADLIDSVDADDGAIDGQCVKQNDTCDGWWGSGSLTFTFDAAALGSLPTHVGVVWTDGAGEVFLEAFGADGASLYKIGPFSEQGFPNDSFESSVQEDRFLGAYDPSGISAITLSNTVGGIEVDHVQYGRTR